jgi:hypothetical protein
MEELRAQTVDLIQTLSEEQVQLVLAYARCLKDHDDAVIVSLEELLENPA